MSNFCYKNHKEKRIEKIKKFYTINCMKKLSVILLTSLGLILPNLTACNGSIDTFVRTPILYGTKEFEGQAIKDKSHLREIDYQKLTDLVTNKENFMIVVHNYDDLCSCWNDFHDDILAPFIKNHDLLFYIIDFHEFDNKSQKYNLQLVTNHETIAIFKEGSITYQKNNADQNDPFTTNLASFTKWMEARIYYPRCFLISEDQLNAKYYERDEFTIYFTRLSCGDCSYLNKSNLIDYGKNHQTMAPLYVIDCDAEGIRTYNGAQPSDDPEASEDAKKAYTQYLNFKKDHGLVQTDQNPAGWLAGACFPCLFHVNPDGEGTMIGDVIDSSAIFYNDSVNKDTGEVTASYFTAERLEYECLTYLRESNIKNKVLLGQKIEPYNQEKHGTRSEWRHNLMKPLFDPIVTAFLDYNVGN